jgi:hypothetical protein
VSRVHTPGFVALGAGLLLAALGCRPIEGLIAVDGIGRDDTHVVAVELAPDGTPRALHGPEVFADGPRAIDIDDTSLGLVALVLRRDQLRALDGEPLDDATWRGLRLEDARDPPGDGACTACRAPATRLPIVVGPGDRCAPSPGIEVAAYAAGSAFEVDLVERARPAVRLRWGGTCAPPLGTPLADVRVPIVGGCAWSSTLQSRPAHVAVEDPAGNTLAVAATGIPWTLTRADGRVQEGTLTRPTWAVLDLASAGVGLWVLALADAEGSPGLALVLVEATDDGLVERDTVLSVDLGMTIDNLVFVPDAPADGGPARGRVVAAGTADGVRDDVVGVVACRAVDGRLRCAPRVVPGRACAAGPTPARPLVIEDRLVWPARDGVLVAGDAAITRIECANRASREFPLRGESTRFTLFAVGASIVHDGFVYSCVADDRRAAILVAPFEPARPGDDTPLAVRLAAAPGEVARVSGECIGFFARADGRAYAVTRARTLLLGPGGTWTATSAGLSDVASLRGAPDGRHLTLVDGDGSVRRLDSDGRSVARAPRARPSPRLVALAAVDDGFVGFPDAGPLVSIPVDAARARATCARGDVATIDVVPIARLGGGPWGPWAPGVDGTWWTWTDRPPRLVEVDLARRVATDHLLQGAIASISDLEGLALSAPGRGVLITGGPQPWRFDARGAGVESTPVKLEGWPDGAPLPVQDADRLVLSGAPGVVWFATDGQVGARRRVVLGRITAVDAVADAAPVLPFETGASFTHTRARVGGVRALASDALLFTAVDEFEAPGSSATRTLLQELGAVARVCADGGPPLAVGRGLGVCAHPHAASAARRVGHGNRFGPLCGTTGDPVVLGVNGFVVQANGTRLGTGLPDVVYAERHRSGVVGALDTRGHLFIGYP